jgi:acyl-CoA thioesterase FadM
MNLWLRILIYLLGAPFRARLAAPFDVSRLRMFVWPNDLDTNLHMNNGRYLTVMDIGRLDLMVRMGLLRPARKNGWIPVLSAAKVRFRRELRLFQRYTLESRIIWWQTTQFVMEHRIVIASGPNQGQVATLAFMLGGIYERSNRRFVPVDDLLAAIGVSATSPEASPEVEAFLAAEQALKRAA